jgi:hypothetical protein
MKQISTGTGLVALAVGMVATAFIATHRGGNEAFAQVTGGDRRIVSAGVYLGPPSQISALCEHFAYRIWSDNAIDVRSLGRSYVDQYQSAIWYPVQNDPSRPAENRNATWHTVDNGTSGFRPLTDVDMSGTTDAGDISQVLMDFNTSSDDLPPPPIDCTINAPR